MRLIDADCEGVQNMEQTYTVKESDFSGSSPKSPRWQVWAQLAGLKPGDIWRASDYMRWVDDIVEDSNIGKAK